ncbi:MAG: malectin domain-containing carbohydrate-binding protein [Chloroflexota bacterium]
MPNCTNEYDPDEPGSVNVNGTGNNVGPGGDDKVNNQNGLHLIEPLTNVGNRTFNYVASQGDYYYGGHPHPILANPLGAGLYTKGSHTVDPVEGDDDYWRNQILPVNDPNFSTQSLPVDWPPIPVADAFIAACDFRNSGQDDNSLANYGPSTNGIAEYTASNFDGALQGNLLLASFNGNIYEVVLDDTGTIATNCPTPPLNGENTVGSCSTSQRSFASGFGATPLDVIAQGDNDPFGGTVWAVTYGADNITVFEPTDYDGADPGVCEGLATEIDEDGDLYTNADEIENGTNPCSGASQPADFDNALEIGQDNSEYKLSDLRDTDDDNDGILDVDDAFNFDASNGSDANAQLPVELEFFNSTGFGYGGIGFTGLMTNGTHDYFILLDDSGDELVFGGTAGIYTDPTVAAGDAFGNTNTQKNGFQFGIDVDAATSPFTIQSQINTPFFGGDNTPDDFASQGIYLGTGDQNNYLKFVLTGNLGSVPANQAGFQIAQEVNGSFLTGTNNQQIVVPNILDAVAIQMYLSVNPADGTVQASYGIDGGERINIGDPITLTGDALLALQGNYTIEGTDTEGNTVQIPSNLAIGTIATSNGVASEFAASWDYMYVYENPSESQALVAVNTGDINGSTFGNGSFNVTNTSTNGATITNVTIDLAGQRGVILPEVVLDPNGTAGDGTAKDVTFSAGQTESGYTGHTFDGAYEGGFYVLDMNFGTGSGGFQPGEVIAFGLDIDPISIKDGSSPGPNQSGSVSGLELTGATVTVTFSTGETWEVDLFRTLSSDSNSTNIARNALAQPLTIEMVGAQDGDTMFFPNQTIIVNGQVEDDVRLLHVESGLFVTDLDGLYAGVGYDIDPFERNSVIGINEYADTIDNSNEASFSVTLQNTDAGGANDITGYNTFVAVVVEEDGATSPVSNIITVLYDPSAAPSFLYRVNTSNATIPSLDEGPDWVATGGTGAVTNPTFSVNTGSISTHDITGRDASVPDYAPQALFAQERWDGPAAPEMEWSFDVTPGTYVVNLFMGNGFGGTSEPGERVFDISIEGVLVENDMDLAATFGHQVGGMVSYTVNVSDTSLNILFEHVVENPTVNAIEILAYSGDDPVEIPISVDPIANQSSVEGDDVATLGLTVNATGGDGNLDYVATGLPAGIQLEPTNGQFFGTITDVAGTYPVTVTVDDADASSADAVSVTFDWIVTEPIVVVPGEVLYRVNNGGPLIADPAGDWGVDQGSIGAANNSPFLAALSAGGSTYNQNAGSAYQGTITLAPSVPAGTPVELFSTERYDAATDPEMLWQFPVPAGTDVEIRLYFAELFEGNGTTNGVNTAGERVFSVSVDGTVPVVYQSIDPFAIAGGELTGIMLPYQTTSDGVIDLEFIHDVENPAIKAIEIVAPSVDAPIISDVDDVTFGELALFAGGDGITDDRLVIEATDLQEDPITFGAEGLPAGLSINATTGEIEGTIGASALTGGPNNDGIHLVTITATDDEENSSSTSFTFTVIDRTVTPTLPVADSVIPTTSALQVLWTSQGGDPTLGSFSDHIHVYFYALGEHTVADETNPVWFGSQPLNPATPLIITANSLNSNSVAAWASYFDNDGFLLPGAYVLEFRHATFNHTEYDSDETTGTPDFQTVEPVAITFEVSETANNLPVVTNPGAQNNVEGEVINLPIVASDPDQGQTLTYSAEGLPPSLSIDADTGVISGVLATAVPGETGGAFIEENGLVVIEMESGELNANWQTASTYSTTTSPNVNDPSGATGGDFIIWQGGQSLGGSSAGNNGLITYQVQINNPGTYQFKWRNQVGLGTNTTEHNDTWLRINADQFYGSKNGGASLVCPSGAAAGTCPAGSSNPAGASGNGWFKVYSSGANNWSWVSNTSDNDAHQIFATFDAPGIYTIEVSARSSSHAIDRMVLVNQSLAGNNGQGLSLPESQRTQNEDGTPGAAENSPYNVTVTATDDLGGATDVEFVWTVGEAIGNPSALVQVTTGQGLFSSTFGNNSFVITNTGDVDITNITIDSSTTFMPDVVFDPVGKAGDNGAKCLTTGTAGDNQATVGITVPANGGTDTADCESVFANPHNGVDDEEGYDTMSLDFTDFNAGESYAFGVDMDPTSIKGDLSTGDAGSISGFELIGGTVTITFANGETITATFTDEGANSLGGSQAVVERGLPAAPTIAVQNVPVTPAAVTNANQTILITGTPGEEVTLLQVDARLYIDPGNPTVGYDVDPFEANEAIAKALYTDVIPQGGVLAIPVALLETAGTGGAPDAGINHFIAFYSENAQPYGNGSETIILELTDEVTTSNLTITFDLQGRDDDSGEMEVNLYAVGEAETPSYTFTATADANGSMTVTGIEPGEYQIAVKHPQFLQVVQTLTLVAGENAYTFGTMQAGDANNDNQVSALDFSVLTTTFNLADGNAGYDHHR